MPTRVAATARRVAENDPGKHLAREVRMRPRRVSPLVPFVMLSLGLMPACTSSHGESADPPPDSTPAIVADGSVRIPKASLRYLRIAPVETEGGSFDIRVPAKAEFKDGAVSHVGAPVAGRVVAIAVKTGDRVRAGQPLLTLASPDAASARNAVASARAALLEAKADASRQDRMMEEGVGVERERLEAGLRLSQAKAEADRAEATAALVGEGSGAELVLKAPLSGTVLDLKTSIGAAVAPGGDPLIDVGDSDAVWIVADVGEHDLPLIKEGATAEVLLNISASPLSARVVSIGTVVNPSLRTAPVRLALAAPMQGLRPGMFGRAHIMTVAQGATLPAEAVLIRGGNDWVVYVAKGDDTFERRSITAGRPLDGRVQVLSGLSPGDRVVVSGALLLDGSAEQLL
jgi:cobalt-zinc-cadmium efflux system membrane fusion protein